MSFPLPLRRFLKIERRAQERNELFSLARCIQTKQKARLFNVNVPSIRAWRISTDDVEKCGSLHESGLVPRMDANPRTSTLAHFVVF